MEKCNRISYFTTARICNQAGINTNVPAAVIKAVNDGTEEMIKTSG